LFNVGNLYMVLQLVIHVFDGHFNIMEEFIVGLHEKICLKTHKLQYSLGLLVNMHKQLF
jgi:hypothetical protein